jgi:O-methyltransferase
MSQLKSIARTLLPDPVYVSLWRAYNAMTERYPKITPLRPRRQWNEHNRQNYIWFFNAQRFLQINRIGGVYAEFGCHEVNTFRYALNTLGTYKTPNKISHFYAFDSFQGMPEPQGIDRQKIWRKGMNYTSLESFKKICKRDMHRITVVPGFFENTLPKCTWNDSHKIALAYIDVDYYNSAKQVISFIADKLQHGSIIAFDDWNCYYADNQRGERKAFAELRDELKETARLEPFLPISYSGMSFIYQQLSKIGQPIL